MKLPQIFTKTFDLNLGNLNFSPSYLQALVIVFLIFLLVLTLARVRRMYVNWNFSSAGSMLFFGFLLALILEGFLIIGGRTMLTEILGWENAPKPIRNALVISREKLAKVLGVTSEVPESFAEEDPDLYDFITQFQRLSPDQAEEFRSMICKP
ncbi:MAG: hypothetical protein P8Y17_02865 [Patescibacteria group bacterium]